MNRYIIITTACKDKNIAESICNSLLEHKIVAGCQVEKIDSSYRWNGNIEFAHEYKLTFTTLECYYDAIEAQIKSLHDYELPEIMATEIRDASAEFLNWIEESTEDAEIEDSSSDDDLLNNSNETDDSSNSFDLPL